MTITFLGTGTSQGVPVIACTCPVCRSIDPRDKRLRTSALLTDSSGANILVDIGPDFRAQMLRHNVSRLDAILLSHAHRDHIGGIDDIRPFNWIQHQDMHIYANSHAIATIRHDYRYIFEHHQYPGLPEATLHDVSSCAPFTVGNSVVTPVQGLHKDLPVLGFRIDDSDGSSLAYITDMNHIDASELPKLSNLDILVINALRQRQHFSHFSLPEALAIIALCQPRKAFLTHISHEMGFHAEVDPKLPENVRLACDNLVVTCRQS